MVNHCDSHVSVQNIKYNFKKISLITFMNFNEIFMKSSLNSENSATHLKSFTGNFCDIAEPYKLFIFQYLRFDSLLVLSHYFI